MDMSTGVYGQLGRHIMPIEDSAKTAKNYPFHPLKY